MNNQLLISEVEQIACDIGEPDCRLTNPYLVNQLNGEIEGTWLQEYSKPGVNSFEIHSDKIVTFFTPRATLLEKYTEHLIK
jgi:hypothetical protein